MSKDEVQQKRGFALLSPEKRREISRKGGMAAHKKGTAHEWSVEEAREAGSKGGLKTSEQIRANKGE